MDRRQSGRLSISAEESEALEVHSEEVRSILGAAPHWIIRAGQGYLLVLLLLVLLLSWVVHYPDTIDAPVTLTGANPPASIVAKSPGYLVLWVRDNEPVKENQYLGYVTNTADVTGVLTLRRALEAFRARFQLDPAAASRVVPRGSRLGELEDAYQRFAQSVVAYRVHVEQSTLRRQREALGGEIESYEQLRRQNESTHHLMQQELELAAARYLIDSALFAARKSSPAEFYEKKRSYLAAQREYQTNASAITNTRITIMQLRDRLSDLAQQEVKEDQDYRVAIDADMSRLEASIRAWEQTYMLKAPMDGRVAFFTYWTDHQYVKTQDEILTVVGASGRYLAKVSAPLERSGKIAVGQRVRISFANYPAEEFGTVTGVVQSISLLPRERAYSITIDMVNGLRTDYGRQLEFRQEMAGSASIITADLRLLDRVLHRVRKTVNAG